MTSFNYFSTATGTTSQASFPREVVARFDGGTISSDGGGRLLKPLKDRTRIVR
jgi:hypothetical protein